MDNEKISSNIKLWLMWIFMLTITYCLLFGILWGWTDPKHAFDQYGYRENRQGCQIFCTIVGVIVSSVSIAIIRHDSKKKES